MGYDDDKKYMSLLRRGDELCGSREIPMPSTVIQEVKGIYKKCKSWLNSKDKKSLLKFGDTPLIEASRLGLENMVWGFIQYAKQTNTNLDTDETGELQKFLCYENRHGQTPLDVAIEKDCFEVVKAFATALEDLSWQQLTDTNVDGKTLLSLLSNHVFDEIIFKAMKTAGKGKVDSISISVDKDNHQVVEAFATALEDVSWQELITDRNDDGKTLMSLLSKHEFDEIIFKAMKAVGKGKVDSSLTSISISVDEDNHQESMVFKEHTMHPNAPPLLSQYNQSTTLNKLDNGHLELDPNGNMIIHLLSQFGEADDLKTILEKHPSLVYRRNHQKETPVFVASREGRLDILELLINCVKVETDLEELVTRSTDKYTALHIAIEKHHTPIVFWLVNRLPQLENCINVFNESPLYFAAQRGYRHILRLILDESKEKSFEGQNGKTALHAAVMSQESVKRFVWDKGFISERESYRHTINLWCVNSLLREKIDLLYIHDKNGWAPFHYAVYHDIGKATVEALLKADRNIGSLDINDPKGRNILHVAIENKRRDTIRKLFGDKQFRTLANQKDSNGNTPLHLFMASDIEIDEMRMDCGVNIYAVNNENLATLDVASSYEKRQILIEAVKTGVWRNLQTSSPSSHVLKSNDSKNGSEIIGQIMSKFGDSLVVVIALIATATFAAAFAVPGGFDGNEGSKQGMPILLRKTAYKAFVVSNAVAFSCSCCVLFGSMRLQFYLVMHNKANAVEEEEEEEEEEIEDGMGNTIALQYLLTGIAMVAMASAFISGTYVILAPSLAFAISLCATCVCIIVPLSFLPTRYFRRFHKLFLEFVRHFYF